MEASKKFKNELPDKKDHSGLKKAGKIMRTITGAVPLIVVAVINKDNIKKGVNMAKAFIKK